MSWKANEKVVALSGNTPAHEATLMRQLPKK